MKRTLSTDAQAAAVQLRQIGFRPANVLPSNGGANPLALMGLGSDATWQEVRQRFVALLRMYPPERCPEEFVQVLDAYEILKRGFRERATAEESCGPSVKRRRYEAGGGGATAVIALDSSGVGHMGQACVAPVGGACSAPAPGICAMAPVPSAQPMLSSAAQPVFGGSCGQATPAVGAPVVPQMGCAAQLAGNTYEGLQRTVTFMPAPGSSMAMG